MFQATEGLENRFNYHPPTQESIREAHKIVRDTLLLAAKNVDRVVPPSREKSIFLTKMEEAMFNANAGIARNHDAFPMDSEVRSVFKPEVICPDCGEVMTKALIEAHDGSGWISAWTCGCKVSEDAPTPEEVKKSVEEHPEDAMVE
jgi:hypothetical protein